MHSAREPDDARLPSRDVHVANHPRDPSISIGVEAAVNAAQAHAARAALRLKTQSHCWAALSTGDTRQILDAVRSLRPSALNSIRSFVSSADATDPDLHHRLHALLDAEAEAITGDARQFERVRDALEKLATTRLHPVVFGRCEGDAEAEADFGRHLAIARDSLTPARLGVAPAYCDGGAWTASAVMLHRLHKHRAPADKVALIVNACRLIERRLHALGAAALRSASEKKRTEQKKREQHKQLLQQYEKQYYSMNAGPSAHDVGRLKAAEAAEAAEAASEPASDSGDHPRDHSEDQVDDAREDDERRGGAEDAAQVNIGADEFFPVLVWVVLHSTPASLPSELAFIARYRHPDRLRGVSGCYFTHLRAAVQFLEMAARGPGSAPQSPASSAGDTPFAGGGVQAPGGRRAADMPADEYEYDGDGGDAGEGERRGRHVAHGRQVASHAHEQAASVAPLTTVAGRWADWLFGPSGAEAVGLATYPPPPPPPPSGTAPQPGQDEGEPQEEASAAKLLGFY